jgi:hypothetical protein
MEVMRERSPTAKPSRADQEAWRCECVAASMAADEVSLGAALAKLGRGRLAWEGSEASRWALDAASRASTPGCARELMSAGAPMHPMGRLGFGDGFAQNLMERLADRAQRGPGPIRALWREAAKEARDALEREFLELGIDEARAQAWAFAASLGRPFGEAASQLQEAPETRPTVVLAGP